jgi:hypothetical protein
MHMAVRALGPQRYLHVHCCVPLYTSFQGGVSVVLHYIVGKELSVAAGQWRQVREGLALPGIPRAVVHVTTGGTALLMSSAAELDMCMQQVC